MSQSPTPTSPPTGDIGRLAENLFREESGKLVSVLTGMFGTGRLQLAEDVVQEALVRAMQTWPYNGIPENPAAWLTQTAKNLALDVLRRETTLHKKEPEIAQYIEQITPRSTAPKIPSFDSEIADDTLRLMFACCHPQVPQDDQIALALKTLCGFGISEIARAFLTTDAAIAKRLTRARQKIRDLQLPFEIPAGEQLYQRLDGVLHTLYLLYNEGYKASSGDSLIREELCNEAIRLTTLLAQHPVCNQPRVHALLALMLLNAARLTARIDTQGHILILKNQDRTLWNQTMIAQGLHYLGRSASGDDLTEYHLQAAISACHCTATDYTSTNWPQILSLYDRLMEQDNSPVIALNRAVAVANVHGSQAGIQAVESIRNRQSLDKYYLLYATLAEFEFQQNNFAQAIQNLNRAIELCDTSLEHAFLLKRLTECESVVEV